MEAINLQVLHKMLLMVFLWAIIFDVGCITVAPSRSPSIVSTAAPTVSLIPS